MKIGDIASAIGYRSKPPSLHTVRVQFGAAHDAAPVGKAGTKG